MEKVNIDKIDEIIDGYRQSYRRKYEHKKSCPGKEQLCSYVLKNYSQNFNKHKPTLYG